MSNPTSPKCPQCGAPIKPDAPAGLCPSCLMVLNLKTETVFTGDTSVNQPPLPPEQIAPHFPQLEILECLGRGGMGVVYKARQKSLNRFVALKLLAPERVTDAKFAERFTREAHALAALNHPHIVTIYDFGQAGGFYFLLMEFVDGVNLRQLLQTRRLKPEEALAIVPPLCDALQYAHEQGIVHRDIKPANLLLDKGGRVKIADFGIAKMVGDSSSIGVTESQPAGTPQYMAPEQKAQHATDHRADIYSLGVVLYEMLTGELPTDKLQPPSRKVQIDVRLDEIVLRALEKTPELRFATAAEFRTQVEAMIAPAAAPLDTTDSSVTPKAVAAATVAAVFFGVLLFGVPFVDMFRVQKDSAYITVILFALVASIFAGFRVWSSLPLLKTSQWWFKPLSVVAFVSAVPAIGLAIFFALNLPQGFDNPSPSEALLVPICFVGALALPLAGLALWRASKPSDSPANVPGSPRISRLAIIGAIWVPVTIASLIAAWLVLQVPRDGINPLWWQLAMLAPLLILAVVGPFGTTILGWLAVAEISRSAGKVHGLKLAVFSGLIYPLMALSAILAGGITYAIRAVTNQPSAGLVSVVLVVAITVLVNVFIVRAVMRAVSKDTAVAPHDHSVMGNQIKLASLALIFALMSAALGMLAAMRSAGAWPAMTLAFVFAGIAIFLALPVRRLGAGKGALIVAALGMVIWPLAALFISRANTTIGSNSFRPVVERVEVTKDRAVVQQRRFDGEGMVITFGSSTNRWTPGGVYLDAMFDIALTGHRFGQGADWIVKPRHGIHGHYRLDGQAGPTLGKLAFYPGTAAVEPDGSYVIGEFKPDNGMPLPISVKLEKTEPSNQEDEIIRLARERLEQTRQLYREKLVSLSQVDEAEGELALAEARGDLVKRAEARLIMATKYLERLEDVHRSGNISDEEYNQAKQRKLEAELELQHARTTAFPKSVKNSGAPVVGRNFPLHMTLTPRLNFRDDELRSLSWHQFDQTKGQYWRALAEVGRYADAAALIERYLGLHPELDLDHEAINGANLHFHAAQCRAFAVHTSGALKHLALAHHEQPTPGGLLWNDYLDGTAAFLRRDRAALQAARDALAGGHEINKANTMVLDRLLANFGKPYRDAYGGEKASHVR